VDVVTLEEVEKRQQKAIAFARNVLQNDDLADSLADEDPRDYAERKHLVVSNSPQRRKANMESGNGSITKADLQDQLDEIGQILSAAYVPESDRETLATAIGDALNVIEGDTGDEDEDDDSDDDQ
jgi:hypothetical protein